MGDDEEVNVLMVDDQPDNLLALESVLESLGEKLVKARSGTEALRRLLDDDFAVILLDVQMPGMNGFETAALIRERDASRNIPIIFITAISTAETHVSTGYSLGAVDYIFKPIVPEVLRSKVAVFVELFRKTRQIKRLNDSLRQQTLDLESANRDLESFSYSVSHDLRAPLRAIRGFAEILSSRHRDSLSEQGRHYMDNIVEASDQMDRLINDLLDYCRLGRGALRFQPVALRDLVDHLLGHMDGRIAQTGVQITVSADLPVVRGDATLLNQVFTNLLENALTYRRPEVPLQVEVGCEFDLDRLLLWVRDNGLGIPAAHLERIFQVFQRLHSDDQYPGTGIGLATVSKAVGLMEGQVWVESVEGEGSTFYVQLPRGKGSSQADSHRNGT